MSPSLAGGSMPIKSLARRWFVCLPMLGWSATVTAASELSEYRQKAAFLYNFALFTEWPADIGPTLNLCVYGPDPFGDEIDGLQGKSVGERSIALQPIANGESLKACQLVFITPGAIGNLPQVLAELLDRPALTVADSPSAAMRGVVLNMAVVQNKITFEAKPQAARAARLNLSSKLLRLATEVQQ